MSEMPKKKKKFDYQVVLVTKIMSHITEASGYVYSLNFILIVIFKFYINIKR